VAAYDLRWKRSAYRDLRGIGRAEAERIREAIESRLLPDPRRGEPLAGSGKPLWKFRVGDYRILYAFNDAQVWILIVRVAHRSAAYRGL
jgi:mRNA interferase RelE/StbE